MLRWTYTCFKWIISDHHDPNISKRGRRKRQCIFWTIHIYTLITSQWQRSSEESALMKVKQRNIVARHIIVSFIRYTHTRLVPTRKKIDGLLHLQFPFWQEACSGSMLVSFEETNDLKLISQEEIPEKTYWREVTLRIFFRKKICPKFESPNGALYWFGADCAGEAPVKGKSKGTPPMPPGPRN